MQKKLYTGILFSLFSMLIYSQSTNLKWVDAIGGSLDDEGYSVIIDSSGNIYVAGNYINTVDFDPGPSVFNLTTPNNSRSGYILKLDSAGKFIWAKSMGGIHDGFDKAIAIDASGNVYMTGSFRGTTDFDPSSATFNLTSQGATDVFVTKLTSNGDFLWAKSMGGKGFENGFALATDAYYNVCIVGRYGDTADFDPGVPTFNLRPKTNSLGSSYDVFITKLDSAGNFIWAKSVGGPQRDEGHSVVIDPAGNIYTTGFYRETADFNPSSGVFTIKSSIFSQDIFVLKLDSAGDFIWAKSMGGSSTDEAFSIAQDVFGDVYITGDFKSTADFDPSSSKFNITASGNEDSFILKLDSNGNFIWAKSIRGASANTGRAIITDPNGGVYIAGSFIGTVDFDPSSSKSSFTSNHFDAYLLKLDINGNYNWAQTLGGNTAVADIAYGVAANAFGDVYLTGSFKDSVDFDPSSTIINRISKGRSDVFVQKLHQCQTSSVDVITACDSIVWIDGITYTANNNTATDTLLNSAGCDSVITLNLTVKHSSTWVDTIVACDSIQWIDGITYTANNNTATHTLINAVGCDSIITLNLTINQPDTGIDVVTACDSYTWIDGITYNKSNSTATHTLVNAFGCDSIVTLKLTINSVDTGIIVNLPNLSANATGATYQWLDCENNYAVITGETGKDLFVSKNGTYAVEVTENGCTDTSKCINVNTIGIVENVLFNNVKIFPNPNKGLVNIDMGGLRKVSVKVYDLKGVLIYQQQGINDIVFQIELDEAPAGTYLLELSTQGEKQLYKLLKQ